MYARMFIFFCGGEYCNFAERGGIFAVDDIGTDVCKSFVRVIQYTNSPARNRSGAYYGCYLHGYFLHAQSVHLGSKHVSGTSLQIHTQTPHRKPKPA
jgi:hypothetical protein